MTIDYTCGEKGDETVMKHFTRKEAADYLRLSLRTFDTLVAEGRIPKYRVSVQRVVFRRDDLDDYVKANLVEPEESVGAAADAVMA